MPTIDITTEPLKLVANGQVVAEIIYQGAPGHRTNVLVYDGEITNVRNFQGGTVEDPNLDISAGGDGSPGQTRGHVGVQWDNGNDFIVADGRKRINFRSTGHDDRSQDRLDSYVKHYFHAGAMVPNGSGGWKKLT